MQSVRAEMLQNRACRCTRRCIRTTAITPISPNTTGKNLIISEVLLKNIRPPPQPRSAATNHRSRQTSPASPKFIRDKKIVSLSSLCDNLKVIPTPPFERGIYSVAGFHSAPPLEPQAEAQFWVTPIDPQMPEAKTESKLREYNDFTLQWLSIHEALPGHYIQFEHLNNIQPERRRLLRSLYANGALRRGLGRVHRAK